MSKKLNLADRVLATGRNFQELGRDQDALRLLGRLAGWQHLAPDISEETLARLAEIHLAHGQFAQARHIPMLGRRDCGLMTDEFNAPGIT